MSENRFVDDNDSTIRDTQTGLVWTKEDSWQRENRWVTWNEAMEFAKYINSLELGNYKGWRLPNIREAKTLFNSEKKNMDKYGKTIHLDPIFTKGPQAMFWLDQPGAGNEGYLMDLTTGEIGSKLKSISGRMAARPVSDG